MDPDAALVHERKAGREALDTLECAWIQRTHTYRDGRESGELKTPGAV